MATLDGQTAFVTGSSRGIGRGIALELARAGADVVVHCRKERAAAEATAAEIRSLGRRTAVVQSDVTNLDALEENVASAVAELGRIDLVVANSGIASRPSSVAKMDPKEWRRVVDVNLHGVFYTCRATVPLLVAQGSGCVIIVSSIGGDTCQPFGAPYYVAKAGANALTKVLARELAPKKIRVNAIAPGVVSSDMGDRMMKALGEETLLAGIPLGRAGTPEEIGKLAVYLASEDAAFVTGQIYRIDGGAWM